ncbi:MAG: acetolactate synthase large subunit [Myxococcota bacterium]
MNGAECLVRSAQRVGVEVCFANPGTTEMHLVAALDRVPGVRAVLGLFEGVCTGAADGYARVSGRPALTVLHLGPGFANGIANLHNARRARTPVVNLIGDHASWHLASDPPLASDIESLARPVSGWLHRAKHVEDLGGDVTRAIAAALRPPGQVATLIVPADLAWSPATQVAGPLTSEPAARVPNERILEVAGALRTGESALLLIGSHGLHGRGLRASGRVAAASGCRAFCETFPARMERGAGLPALERLPYFPEQILELLGGIRHLILAGATAPVAFFGYPDRPSRLVPESCRLHELAWPDEDVAAALEELADALDAPTDAPGAESHATPLPDGELTPVSLGAAIAATQPEGLIVVDEAATSGLPYFLGATGCPPHTYMSLTGGAIGQGLPCATGAAIAAPDRRVLAFQADGSGMYTLQALWTQAREGLDVTTVICANRSYRILRIELDRAAIGEPGPRALDLTDLSRPTLNWVSLGQGMGVPSVCVETTDALVTELRRAFSEPGPRLIEAVL